MKRTTTRLGATVLAAALGLAALAGCASDDTGATPDTGSATETTKLRVSIPPVADSLPVFVAIDEGYFEERGLEVELVPAANGATAVNSLVSSSTEIALVSYPTLVNAHSAGLPVTIGAFGIEGTDEYMAAIYVTDDSPLASIDELIGKKVATPSLNSVGDIFLSGEMLDAGLDPKQVEFVEIPQANMAGALGAGDVDAVFLTEPTLSAASKELELRPLAVQNGPQGLFATSKKFLEENEGAIKAFREALEQAVRDIEADPSGVAERTMPNHSNMDAETAAAMHLPLFQTKWNEEGIQKIIDLMAELGIIKNRFEADELYTQL
ncbi:ABC transporter substrate-binding protein [Ruicaihuangia caeni]|uniref:ABC transporter substrate-binding protein n=1 Tax=Ruicaihuangia caeni TaxID=3042517 RepID=A0AAW6T8E7_9MICO|nr:ABC transporter substrate-binding protein [Klugiella sp. YN-L-19]MDI2099026.1 ABC transporter substrate-binding protein [Klugiella sp. YN-L-19]